MEYGKLYIVGTPIGNMGDITLRAIETLKNADWIACEDTRHSLPLLERYGVKKPTFSCHRHNEQNAAERIIALIKEGKSVALISDAGMPCISDPGALTVKLAAECGVKTEVVPGPNAAVCAMALSGITRRGFCFLGFLPEKKKRKELLEPYANVDITLVFYSAPHDLNSDLDSLYGLLGERNLVIAKEITKLHESVERGMLSSLRVENPRGEYVIVIEGRDIEKRYPEDLTEHYRLNLERLRDKKEAIKATARERGVNKDAVYKAAIEDNRD